MFYMFLADGFEETEAIATLDVMRRAGLEVQTVGVKSQQVVGTHNVAVIADILIDDAVFDNLEGVVLPGGMPGTTNLENCKRVIDFVKYANDNQKIVAAICAAPSIPGHLGILKGKNATCFPGFESELNCKSYTASHTTTDGLIVTAKGAGCAIEFGQAIVSLAKSKEVADKIVENMQCL